MNSFAEKFGALTGFSPFRWQARLYERFAKGDVPPVCRIPTGLGKTAAIPIWLIALTDGACLPRRLFYVVNRRTVVDQATSVVEQIRGRLLDPDHSSWREAGETLRMMRDRLRKLAGEDAFLAASTLRGQMADNAEWKQNPARPAIIASTIDMIGSKLLFSGYGDGRYGRVHHAGLAGQDSLVVHDEAHLTPAFGQLLRSIEAEQQKTKEEKARSIRVMELSATARDSEGDTALALLPGDDEEEAVKERLRAEKTLVIHSVEKQQIVSEITQRASAHEPAGVKLVVYVRSPEQALHLQAKLASTFDDGRLAILTGTLRGFERDRLVRESRVYRALLDPRSTVVRSVCLISTSAGEVGIDLDADHAVCDGTTLDSTVQRLGRVNRRGGRRALVDIVVEKTDREPANGEDYTLRVLRRLPRKGAGYDASVQAIDALLASLTGEERRAAFQSNPPTIYPADITYDAWALTSVTQTLPGRPEVAAYLHGITADPPHAFVAWRGEVPLLHRPEVSPAALSDWFRACRLKPHEILHDRTDRVVAQLERAQSRLGLPVPVVVLTERGDARTGWLSDVLAAHEDGVAPLNYRTILLSPEAGCLRDGLLDGSSECASDVAEDEANASPVERRRIVLTLAQDGQAVAGPLALGKADTLDLSRLELVGEFRSDAARIAKALEMRVARIVPPAPPLEADPEAAIRFLVLLTVRTIHASPDPEASALDTQPTVEQHNRTSAEAMERIANALGLAQRLREALVLAAKCHDLGKARTIWQRAIYNDPAYSGRHLAKSGPQGMDIARLDGYRHELGSLLDARALQEVYGHPERDLILHLIATHHGHGRPHFEWSAYSLENHTFEQNEQEAQEQMCRFCRLQLRFGRWALAWLESLLRCADATASGSPNP